MQSVLLLIVIMLSVIKQSVAMLIVVMITVIMPSMPYESLCCLTMMSFKMLNVILSVSTLSVAYLILIMLNALMLIVVMLTVLAPENLLFFIFLLQFTSADPAWAGFEWAAAAAMTLGKEIRIRRSVCRNLSNFLVTINGKRCCDISPKRHLPNAFSDFQLTSVALTNSSLLSLANKLKNK